MIPRPLRIHVSSFDERSIPTTIEDEKHQEDLILVWCNFLFSTMHPEMTIAQHIGFQFVTYFRDRKVYIFVHPWKIWNLLPYKVRFNKFFTHIGD